MTALIIGSGGHAKVVIDALHSSSPDRVIHVRDGNQERQGAKILGLEIDTPELPEAVVGMEVHVAIGSAAHRQRLLDAACAAGGRALTIIHSAASVAASAGIGEGCFVAAGAIAGPNASVGRGCILNHNSVVDHDCVVGNFSHVGPNVTLGGGVRIGVCCEIGAGANILPGVQIADAVIIGAGAVVTRSIESGGTWVGVPAVKSK